MTDASIALMLSSIFFLMAVAAPLYLRRYRKLERGISVKPYGPIVAAGIACCLATSSAFVQTWPYIEGKLELEKIKPADGFMLFIKAMIVFICVVIIVWSRQEEYEMNKKQQNPPV